MEFQKNFSKFLAIIFLVKNQTFGQKWNLFQKWNLLFKNGNFGQTLKFWSIVKQFYQKSKFAPKILVKNVNFGQKLQIFHEISKFSPKIEFFVKNPNFGQKS